MRIASLILLTVGFVSAVTNLFQDQVIFEHKHQRNFIAPPGTSVVKQIIESVKGKGAAPVYSFRSGTASGDASSLPSIGGNLPLTRAADEVTPGRKMQRTGLSGIMQSMIYAAKPSIPNISSSSYVGAASQSPILFWQPHDDQPLDVLDPSDFHNAINISLTTAYPIYNGTQTMVIPSNKTLQPLNMTPWFGRDNGKGGYLNGEQIFLFADTGTHPLDGDDHDMTDFWASSVAVDRGRRAATGQSPVLVDMPGEYEDEQAALRGFVGYTHGEYAFSDAQGDYGNRYALWPESGITPLDSTRALHWAAIVYVCASCSAVFTTAGNTLLEISIDPVGGPHAERVVTELFGPNEIQYGTVGGVRSWGSEGPGGMDGYVYAIATMSVGVSGGLLLSRVAPEDVANRTAYEYYHNSTRTWSSSPPNVTDPAADFFLGGAYANVDLLYSPRYLTWVLVYETPYADNRFYYQYLKAPGPVKPDYAGGSYADLVSAVYEYPWSEPIVLYQTPVPANGKYVYGGGIQVGYFGPDDFVNGGTKMLLQWTEPLSSDDWREYYTDFAIINWE